ncbi:hypothetical protein LzC2_26460 [Planctomycetes bacterium LzC2]|uniref:Uncharacterized protein n=1 Tax=Alienimonas chondri TaxID=2681879 RepID=A0ABX1VFA3_9PLAN|nr:hypothetical protein [Alienimonas chondri]
MLSKIAITPVAAAASSVEIVVSSSSPAPSPPMEVAADRFTDAKSATRSTSLSPASKIAPDPLVTKSLFKPAAVVCTLASETSSSAVIVTTPLETITDPSAWVKAPPAPFASPSASAVKAKSPVPAVAVTSPAAVKVMSSSAVTVTAPPVVRAPVNATEPAFATISTSPAPPRPPASVVSTPTTVTPPARSTTRNTPPSVVPASVVASISTRSVAPTEPVPTAFNVTRPPKIWAVPSSVSVESSESVTVIVTAFAPPSMVESSAMSTPSPSVAPAPAPAIAIVASPAEVTAAALLSQTPRPAVEEPVIAIAPSLLVTSVVRPISHTP